MFDDVLPHFRRQQTAFVIPVENMRRCARPGITPGYTHHFCPHRIVLHITESGKQVIIGQRIGEKAVLPQVSATAVQPIDGLDIDSVRAPDGLGQTFFRERDSDQMDVVGHEAIAQNIQAVPFGLLVEYVEIQSLVVIDEENILLIISPLGDMMSATRNHDSGFTCHA